MILEEVSMVTTDKQHKPLHYPRNSLVDIKSWHFSKTLPVNTKRERFKRFHKFLVQHWLQKANFSNIIPTIPQRTYSDVCLLEMLTVQELSSCF